MELDFTPEQRTFRDELRTYLAGMMTDALTRELSDKLEGGGPEFRAAMKRMGVDGLLGLSWPKKYGGQERSAIEQFIFADEVQGVGFPLPFLTLNTIGPMLLLALERTIATRAPRLRRSSTRTRSWQAPAIAPRSTPCRPTMSQG